MNKDLQLKILNHLRCGNKDTAVEILSLVDKSDY